MLPPSACPSVESLKQFRLGLAPEASSPQVEQHLSACSSCLGRLAALAPNDALGAGAARRRNRPRLNNPLLAKVQQDIRARPFRPRPNQENFATIGEPPSPEATVAVAPGEVNGLEMAHALLSPPKGAGEIGWLGPFRVLRVLGAGGMGVVLQAEDSRLQRRVALKVMKPELASDPSARQRFLREARATAALEHEHVIAIHHIDECNGAPYLAMPLLQGESLEDRLRREPVLPVREVLRIGRETAKGLAAAHERELIHRDIKPGNLWLEAPSGRVKILDFGLAAMACPEGEKTLPGTLLGTPGYMAPEQTEGKADHRADLFSLGCLLYRLATGRPPFKGKSLVEKIRSTLFDTPEPPQQINPALPPALCQLIQRLMAQAGRSAGDGAGGGARAGDDRVATAERRYGPSRHPGGGAPFFQRHRACRCRGRPRFLRRHSSASSLDSAPAPRPAPVDDRRWECGRAVAPDSRPRHGFAQTRLFQQGSSPCEWRRKRGGDGPPTRPASEASCGGRNAARRDDARSQLSRNVGGEARTD